MYWFLDKLLSAYLFALAAFLFLRLLMDPARERTVAWLNLANALGAGIIYIHLVFVLYQTLAMKQVQDRITAREINPVLHYDLRFGYENILRLILLTGILPLFFLLKKFRQKIYLSVSMVILLVIYQYLDGFYVVLTSMYRDYLPSSWSVYGDQRTGELWWTIFFAALYFANCWLLSAPKTAVRT